MNQLLNPEFYTNIGSLVGCKGTVTTYDEDNFEGVFVAFNIKTSEWMFEKIYRIGDNGLLTKDKDHKKVVTIPAVNMKSAIFMKDDKEDQATKSAQKFAIDPNISSASTHGDSAAVVAVGEKEYSPWNDDDGEEIIDLELLSAVNSLTSSVSDGWEAQDIFKKNKENYGVTSFCPELIWYTTKLDKTSSAECKKQEELTIKIANEIEGNSSSRDRAMVENCDDVDEEEAFSAVIRPSSSNNNNNANRNGQPSLSSTSIRINSNGEPKPVTPPRNSNTSQSRQSQPQHEDIGRIRPPSLNSGPTPLLTNPPRRPNQNGNGGTYQNNESRNYGRWPNPGNVYQDRRYGGYDKQYQYDSRRGHPQNHYYNNNNYSNGNGGRMDYVGNRQQQQQQQQRADDRNRNNGAGGIVDHRGGSRRENEAGKFKAPQQNISIKQEYVNNGQNNPIVTKTSPPSTSSNNGPSTSTAIHRQQPPIVAKSQSKNGKVVSLPTTTNVPALIHQATGQLPTTTTSSTDKKIKTESVTSTSSTGTRNLSPMISTATTANNNNTKVTSAVPHKHAHPSGGVSSSNSMIIKVSTDKGSGSGDKRKKFTFNPEAKEFELTPTSIPCSPTGNNTLPNKDIPRRQPRCAPVNHQTPAALPAPMQPQFSQHQNQPMPNIQLPPPPVFGPPPPPPFRQAQQQQYSAFTPKAQTFDDGTTYYHNHGGICLYNNQRRGGDGLTNTSTKMTPSTPMTTSSGPPPPANSGAVQSGGQGQPQNVFEDQRNAFNGQQYTSVPQHEFVPPRAYPPQAHSLYPQAQQHSAPVPQAPGTTYYYNNGNGQYQNGSLRRGEEGLLGVSSYMPEMSPSMQVTPSGPILVTSAFVQPVGQPQHARNTFEGQQYTFVPHGAYPRPPQVMMNGFVQTSGGLMPMFQPQLPRTHEVGPVSQIHPNVQYNQANYENGPAPGHQAPQAMNYNQPQPWLPGMPQEAEYHPIPMPLGYPPINFNFIPVNAGYQQYVPPYQIQMAQHPPQLYPVPPPGYNFIRGGPVYPQMQ